MLGADFGILIVMDSIQGPAALNIWRRRGCPGANQGMYQCDVLSSNNAALSNASAHVHSLDYLSQIQSGVLYMSL